MNKLQYIKRIYHKIIPPKFGWFGSYSTWSEALSNCSGYNSEAIFSKVSNAALQVKNGNAVFERDGVMFFKEELNWQMLAALMLAASQEGNTLHVTDFGGSLGSSFFQHRKFLNQLTDHRWAVVEQSHFVEFGNKNLANNKLAFYNTIQDCLIAQQPNILVLSSVLQYLENPFTAISDFVKYGFKYIFLDRTAFTSNKSHEITVQRVSPEIYDASYPAWFFNEEDFINAFKPSYSVLAGFENDDYTNRDRTYFKGFIFEKK